MIKIIPPKNADGTPMAHRSLFMRKHKAKSLGAPSIPVHPHYCSPKDSSSHRSPSGRGHTSFAALENPGDTDPAEPGVVLALSRAPDSRIRAGARRPATFPERGAQCGGSAWPAQVISAESRPWTTWEFPPPCVQFSFLEN